MGPEGDRKVGEDEAPSESVGASKSGWLHAASKSLCADRHCKRALADIPRGIGAEKIGG